jgi:hypothetical protein
MAVQSIDALIGLAGSDVTMAPLPSAGFSNASITRLTSGDRCFVLKRTTLDRDWTARRSNDARGREALLLSDPACAPVWDVFDCPYIAYTIGDGEIALLMRDLTEHLLPDARTPLTDRQETALLSAIARMHARFWGSRAPEAEWLTDPQHFCDLLAPSCDGALLPSPLRENVTRGWAAALARVPAAVAERLTCPGSELAREWDDLPRTMLHGDVKVANFALLEDGAVAAFDWAMCGAGPCSVDLGWYLAVNASRLTASKEEIIRRYRTLLDVAVDDDTWERLEEAAIVSGARMLLWSKAVALESGRAGAEEEWNWWIERLRG